MLSDKAMSEREPFVFRFLSTKNKFYVVIYQITKQRRVSFFKRNALIVYASLTVDERRKAYCNGIRQFNY